MTLQETLLARGRPGDEWTRCGAVLVRADAVHEIDARDATVLIGFVDSESELGAALCERINGDILRIRASQVARWRAALGPTLSEARVERWVRKQLLRSRRAVTIHPSVDRVLKYLRERLAVADDFSLDSLAGISGLSRPRFIHVFTESVGFRLPLYSVVPAATGLVRVDGRGQHHDGGSERGICGCGTFDANVSSYARNYAERALTEQGNEPWGFDAVELIQEWARHSTPTLQTSLEAVLNKLAIGGSAISIVRWLLVLLGTAVYLGLAVFGWGGFAAFFSHPALVALTIATFALSAMALFAGGSLSPGVREDRANRWVLVAFALIGLLDAYLPAWADRNEFWTLDGDVIRWLGVVLFAAGGALRLWPVVALGRRFSGLVAIQPGHTLVTTGIYGVIRHPSYLGLLVNSLGWGLAFRSGIGVLLAALLIAPVVARIRAEERLLRTEFGAAYDDYCARTSRLIPGVY
jgi:protein-S-isoprenylcysteine O-methyltransferase Ste14